MVKNLPIIFTFSSVGKTTINVAFDKLRVDLDNTGFRTLYCKTVSTECKSRTGFIRRFYSPADTIRLNKKARYDALNAEIDESLQRH